MSHPCNPADPVAHLCSLLPVAVPAEHAQHSLLAAVADQLWGRPALFGYVLQEVERVHLGEGGSAQRVASALGVRVGVCTRQGVVVYTPRRQWLGGDAETWHAETRYAGLLDRPEVWVARSGHTYFSLRRPDSMHGPAGVREAMLGAWLCL